MFLNMWGKTMIINDDMDVLTFWHREYQPDFDKEEDHQRKLLPIMEEVMHDMGFIEGLDISGNDLEINGKKFGTKLTMGERIENNIETLYEMALITYNYDDELFRYILPDKEYYKAIKGGFCNTRPDDTIIDYSDRRCTGIENEFVGFNRDDFRRRMCIKAAESIGADTLIMRKETAEKFFPKKCVSFTPPNTDHIIYKYTINNI